MSDFLRRTGQPWLFDTAGNIRGIRSPNDSELIFPVPDGDGESALGGGPSATFWDIRANGYGGTGTPGATLAVLDGSSDVNIQLEPGVNFFALNCGGACTITATHNALACAYEVVDSDGASSAVVTQA